MEYVFIVFCLVVLPSSRWRMCAVARLLRQNLFNQHGGPQSDRDKSKAVCKTCNSEAKYRGEATPRRCKACSKNQRKWK